MEFLVFLLICAAFVLFIQNSGLKTRMRGVEARLDALGAAPAYAEAEHVLVAPPAEAVSEPAFEAPAEVEEEALVEDEPAPAMALAAEPESAPDGLLEEEAAQSESLGQLFERLIAGKLLIWVGGVALMVAGFLLVRYSIEMGLMTPQARMIGAAVFGFTLLAAGEYSRYGRFRDDPRIAQALVGAGLAVLYGTAYGAHILYGLIGSGTASAAMLAVTALALVQSLRHGAPTAVLGLIGGFLTPLLVGDPNAGAVSLLAYLALLDVAVFLIAWRKNWTWLAAAAVALSFVWSAYVIFRPDDGDAIAGGVFVVLISLGAAVIRPGEGRQLKLIQPLAIGIVQLTLLVGRIDVGLTAWALFFALGGASMILAVLRHEYRLAPPLALGFALVLLASKSAFLDPASVENVDLLPWAAAGITLLFGVVAVALAVWKRGLYWTAVACAGLAAPLLILRGQQPFWLSWTAWGLEALVLAAGPALLIWFNRDRARAEPPPELVQAVAGGTTALLLCVAVWDLALHEWAAAGWLGAGLGLALAARRFGDLALGLVAVAVGAIAVGEALYLLPDLAETLAGGLFGEPVLAIGLPGAMRTLSLLAAPALLLAAIAFVLPPLPLHGRRVAGLIAGLFAVGAAYVWFKQAFGLSSHDDYVARGLIERTILNQALFLAGWVLASGRVRLPRIAPDTVKLAGTLLTVLATLRLIWFDMLLHDPAFVDQWVGPLPVLNLLLPAFLLSAAWLYLARRAEEDPKLSGPWLIAFLAALIVGVALMVRQGFHGAILNVPDTPIAEFYAYSLAGILLAIALLVAGIRLPDKALRLAGLILLTATILKVFLVDASELEGVLRILSFLGLGIALIGIGRLYGPVLRAESKPA